MILSTIVSKKLLADDETTAWVKQICLLGVISKVSNTQTWLSFETFCFLEKRLPSIFKFCAWSNLLFFLKLSQSPFPVSAALYELLTSLRPAFSECIFIFPQSNWSTLSCGPGYRSRMHCSTLKGIALLSLEALKHAAAVLIRVCLWTRERFRVVFASRFMIPTRLFLQIHDSRRLITWT